MKNHNDILNDFILSIIMIFESLNDILKSFLSHPGCCYHTGNLSKSLPGKSSLVKIVCEKESLI